MVPLSGSHKGLALRPTYRQSCGPACGVLSTGESKEAGAGRSAGFPCSGSQGNEMGASIPSTRAALLRSKLCPMRRDPWLKEKKLGNQDTVNHPLQRSQQSTVYLRTTSPLSPKSSRWYLAIPNTVLIISKVLTKINLTSPRKLFF